MRYYDINSKVLIDTCEQGIIIYRCFVWPVVLTC